ncbi:hypothetical protein [Rhodobacter ferrooxidans]|nr:hypothetical protein [Rhodobacter sp. SW2]
MADQSGAAPIAKPAASLPVQPVELLSAPLPEPLIVTLQDLRAARLCFQGARPWFRRQGLDWQQFQIHGIDAEILAASGDALALRVIEAARNRVGRDG